MATKLIIDSACDIPYEKAEKMGWIFLPLTVTFGDRQYLDGIDLDPDSFFDKLVESDELPSTSQLTPYEYERAFKDVASAGDEAVVITLSSKLSGTYQNACIAAQNYPGRIYVVDSLNATLGEAILIEYAQRLVEGGMAAKAIAAELSEKRSKIRLLGLLYTLEYLKKGGRISPTVAFAGALLSIKPVVSVEEGEIKLVGKARGSKNGNNLLAELINRCGEIDFDMPFSLAYSGKDRSVLDKYVEDSRHFWEGHTSSLPIIRLCAAIGTHIGPGGIAVAFFEK